MMKFALGAAASAALGGALLAWAIAGGDSSTAAFAWAGFVSMTLPGIAGGAWLAHEHGRPGSRFVLALGAGFLARIVLAGVVAFGASRAGGESGSRLLAGLAAGFIPVTVFEMVWFACSLRRSGIAPEARG
jgi:hypothetical protein